MSHGLQADVHYTYSRTKDEATHSNGGGQTMDNYDPMRDYGPANWDVPHRFVASYIYEVPFFKQSSNGFLKYVLSGWQIAGVTTLQSGIPANITFAADRANIGIAGLQRPDLIGSVPDLNCQPNSGSDRGRPEAAHQLLRPSGFAARAVHSATRRRNILRGPNFKQTDITLMKDILLGRRSACTRAEGYNVFNRANFANPNTTFGSARSQHHQPATGATMRRIQLGGRLIF
jgi:hypothetical protein